MSILKKCSAKKTVSADVNDLVSAGLPDDMLILLGNKESKMYKKMLESAKKLGLTPQGVVLGPARISETTKKSLTDKKSR